jgi:hypothetical protein
MAPEAAPLRAGAPVMTQSHPHPLSLAIVSRAFVAERFALAAQKGRIARPDRAPRALASGIDAPPSYGLPVKERGFRAMNPCLCARVPDDHFSELAS